MHVLVTAVAGRRGWTSTKHPPPCVYLFENWAESLPKLARLWDCLLGLDFTNLVTPPPPNSVRLVEAENLDWHLFRVSVQRPIILPCIRAQFSFKLDHANFPTCIKCLHTTLYLTPCYHETCISYLCSIENPPNVHLGNFLKTLKMEASHCIFVELTINATFVTMESFKQIMQVGIFLVIK